MAFFIDKALFICFHITNWLRNVSGVKESYSSWNNTFKGDTSLCKTANVPHTIDYFTHGQTIL